MLPVVLSGREAHLPKSFYRRNLPHLQRDNKFHFLTFCTYQRRILPNWARDLVLQACVKADGATVDLRVVVVMPDHVHVLFVPLVDATKNEVTPLARITKAMKGASAHLINRRSGRVGPVWQEESFDRVLRSSEKVDEKIAYILENPRRKGLASDWREYPWLWYKPFENPCASPRDEPVAKITLPSCARPGR
jgi:putative transposase